MNDLPQQEQPTSDTFDFSDNEALQPRFNPQSRSRFEPQPSRHGGGISAVASFNMAHIANVDRNEYSDEDIGIMYEIVVRAETILAEDLTPSTGLQIHALFLAYEEIIAEHGLDPSERHISKLVFMVGYVKGEQSIMDKFKAVMAQMNITLAIEEPPASDSERGYREGHYAASDAEDFRSTGDDHTSLAHISEPETDDRRPGSENVPGLSMEPLNSIKEKHLADTALAFEKQRHARSLAVATLRRWHNTAHYVNYLRGQSDAIRRAELSQALADRFHSWRALAAEAAQAAPNSVPQNAYSKRTERIAIRAHDILLTKKALIKWRQSAQEEYRRNRGAKSQAHRLAKQKEYEDEDFKDNPELARLAQRAHKNLVLSQAFTKWSNRVEEEGAKAEAASMAYEMSLKAKALGFARNRSAMDEMRKLLASKTNSAPDSMAGQIVTSDTKQPEPEAPAIVKPAAVPVASISRPPPERPLSSTAITTMLQSRRTAEKRPTPSVPQPSAVIPIHTAPPTTTPIDGPAAGATATSASPVEPVPADKPTANTDAPDDDQPDERTMLARRHILRLRYFGAWERYTRDNVVKVEQFEQEIQDQHVANSVPKWRNATASRQQQAVECNIEFVQTQCYQRMAQIIPKWREKASQETYRRGKVLEHYAERAEYYQKTTKSLPVLREKTGQAEQREKLLKTYAERTNYYMRTTQALSIWRERARDVSEVHQLQENYGKRADYYYRTRSTLSTWQHRAKQKRKERLREAHLETRRMVKKNMGERCVRQWREKLEPSYQRFEIMNVALVDALEDREWRHASQAFTTWRCRAQERTKAVNAADVMLKQKALEQWREKATLHRDLETEAGEHWEVKAKSRALRNWNLGSLQGANRPEMVANALEKKERRLLRQGFETWYGRTADKLVPVELPNGTYRNVGQVLESAQHQAAKHQARGLLQRWKAAAAESRVSQVSDEAYAPTPGRPHLFLGSYGGRETTTPLAPVPSYTRWQARDSTMGRSEYGARVGRAERTKNAKNLRVSWAT